MIWDVKSNSQSLLFSTSVAKVLVLCCANLACLLLLFSVGFFFFLEKNLDLVYLRAFFNIVNFEVHPCFLARS